MLALARWVAGLAVLCALTLLSACGGADSDLGSAQPESHDVEPGSGWATGGAAGAAGAAGGGGAAGAAAGAGVAGSGGASGSGGMAGSAGSAGASSSLGGAAGATGAVPADCPRVRVDVPAGSTLNVRPTPSTAKAPVGTLDDGEIVDVLALVHGETLDGSDLWYQIKSPALTGYVFSGLVACTTDSAPKPLDGYYLPLVFGKSAKVSQGNFGSYSHQGSSAYAFDFSLGVGTPMVAMADGTVTHVYDKTGPGDPCYDGGGSQCAAYANIVVLKHADGKSTLYAHLSKVNVTKGQKVSRGTKVGLSGSTGYSTGPHAHVARMESCGYSKCQSIPLKFVDYPGGVPKTGATVTSGNCP